MLSATIDRFVYVMLKRHSELFFEPIRTLSENLNMMLQAMVSGERLFDVLDTPAEIEDKDEIVSEAAE